MTTQLYCPDDTRRRRVRDSGVNGIDHLEVLPTGRTLLVHCFRSVAGLDKGNVLVHGGTVVRGIGVEWALPGSDPHLGGLLGADELAIVRALPRGDRALVVQTDRRGDFSTYTLRLVAAPSLPDRPPPGFDPIVSSVAFSFMVDCPSDFDCAPDDRCDELAPTAPLIDYLAKDYASFRRLMLDRLSVVLPDWRERSPADVLVALVELLAHAGDLMSYFQDAVATEAYLGTARRRSSVRRHARLVDYRMHDGANARTWVSFTAGDAADGALMGSGTRILTGEAGADVHVPAEALEEAVSRGAVVFETMHGVELRNARDEIPFHTWGDDRCCLPPGATKATLLGRAGDLGLARGDVLIFEEVRAPDTGRREDADPAHRHAVRLAREPVEVKDPLGPVVLEIEWHAEDALPFPLCLWERRLGDGTVERTSIVRGNVALADHGRWITESDGATLKRETLGAPIEGRRFRPRLDRAGLTQAAPFDHKGARGEPAARATAIASLHGALPQVVVLGEEEPWEPARELFGSDRFAPTFVAEMEEDGRATLRFGDGVYGRLPAVGESFTAVYRIGSGTPGNVGAGALSRVVTDIQIKAVTNPLPATGGTDAEAIDQVRLYAPHAFRNQQRAVTAADYVAVAEQHPEVQRAGATRRWTGSWYTMFITVDRLGGREVDKRFEDEMRHHLDSFRLAGDDLEIDGPRFVPLDVAITVCVAPGYTRSDAHGALLDVLGSRALRGGRRGFFHPDNFTFGEAVYLSRLIAAAMSVPGVGWVDVTRFQRFREAPGRSLEQGRIELGRLEIARLDNDPNRPENGRLELELKGGF